MLSKEASVYIKKKAAGKEERREQDQMIPWEEKHMPDLLELSKDPSWKRGTRFLLPLKGDRTLIGKKVDLRIRG